MQMSRVRRLGSPRVLNLPAHPAMSPQSRSALRAWHTRSLSRVWRPAGTRCIARSSQNPACIGIYLLRFDGGDPSAGGRVGEGHAARRGLPGHNVKAVQALTYARVAVEQRADLVQRALPEQADAADALVLGRAVAHRARRELLAAVDQPHGVLEVLKEDALDGLLVELPGLAGAPQQHQLVTLQRD